MSYSTSGKKLKLSSSSSSPSSSSPSSSSSAPSPPEYDPGVSAYDFFKNPFFNDPYYIISDEAIAQRKSIFEDKTLYAVLQACQPQSKLYELMNGTGIDVKKVVPFWILTNKSIEDKLNETICVLCGENEILKIKKNFVKLPVYPAIGKYSGATRADDIRFVLGSSGSGKTFFAIRMATTEHGCGKSVIFYCKLEDSNSKLVKDPSLLVDEIREKIRKKKSNFNCYDKLQMHVTVVLDEAGLLSLDGHLELLDNIKKIYSSIITLSDSVRLVIAGTGLTAKNLSSDSDVIKYRMKALTKIDIARLINKEIDDVVIRTIYQIPILQSLTSNARSACFLVDEINNLVGTEDALNYGTSDTDKMSSICDSTGYLINRVSARYICENGLAGLGLVGRRRVACRVLEALDLSENSKVPFLPDFKQLVGKEKMMAFSLLEINVEIVSGELAIAPDRKNHNSLTITPALTVIAYWMLGVRVSVLLGWKSQEAKCALFEFRRQVLRQARNCKNAEHLDDELLKLKLIQLKKLVPSPRSKLNFLIPYVDKSTIWINGEMAPFADVVARNILYQCKYTKSNKKVQVDLAAELRKCGLARYVVPKNAEGLNAERLAREFEKLNTAKRGWITLRSLIAMWDGDIKKPQYDSHEINMLAHVVDDKGNHDDKKGSVNFYPESLLYPSTAISFEDIYMNIRYDDNNENKTKNSKSITDLITTELNSDGLLVVQNKLDSQNDNSNNDNIKLGINWHTLKEEIIFVISCNSKKIELKGEDEDGEEYKLEINTSILSNSEVDEKKLQGNDAKYWSLLKNVAVEKVKLQFYLD